MIDAVILFLLYNFIIIHAILLYVISQSTVAFTLELRKLIKSLSYLFFCCYIEFFCFFLAKSLSFGFKICHFLFCIEDFERIVTLSSLVRKSFFIRLNEQTNKCANEKHVADNMNLKKNLRCSEIFYVCVFFFHFRRM